MKIKLTKQGRKVWTGILLLSGIALSVFTEGAMKLETIGMGQALLQLITGTSMATLGIAIMPENT